MRVKEVSMPCVELDLDSVLFQTRRFALVTICNWSKVDGAPSQIPMLPKAKLKDGKKSSTRNDPISDFD